MFVVVENSWRCWQSHPSQISPPALFTSFLLHPIPLLYISQMPAGGYGGFNFPDLSMSEHHNGFQPRLLPTANFTSGINDGALHSEIRQLSAQLLVVERDLAVEK
jgi:hypothetical protein